MTLLREMGAAPLSISLISSLLRQMGGAPRNPAPRMVAGWSYDFLIFKNGGAPRNPAPRSHFLGVHDDAARMSTA